MIEIQKMAGVPQEVLSTPLDLSKKLPTTTSTVTSSNQQSLVGLGLQYIDEDVKIPRITEVESKALDLTKSIATVSFHRAIPVTTTVPSTYRNLAGNSEGSKYSTVRVVENIEQHGQAGIKVETTMPSLQGQTFIMKTLPAQRQRYSPVLRPKESAVGTAAEATSTTEEIPSNPRLSPTIITYQQQSAMRNFVDMDTGESPRLPQGGMQTVIVANSPGLLPRTATPENAALSGSHGNLVMIPMSEFQRLKELQERGSTRKTDDPPPSKTKTAEGRNRITLAAAQFHPYSNPRTISSTHRSVSIPTSQTIQAISPMVSAASVCSSSPVVPVTMAINPSRMVQAWTASTTSTNTRSDSSVELTYSVLGKPQVVASPLMRSGEDRVASVVPKQEGSQPSKTAPSSERLPKTIAISAVATSKAETSGQGLPINPFYSLSIAVDCHRATAQDSDGDTPLHIAIVQEQPDLAYIQRLIHLVKMTGKTLDIFNYMQQTPLHLAAITNNIEVIRIMLEAGANPNEADRNGQTTVHHACCNRNSPCMSVIFKYSTFDIDLEKRNFNGHTPLHVAVEKGDKVLVRMLLDHEANVNSMDSRNGWTPLFNAVANKDIKMLGILVEFGAKVNAQSYSGNSSLHIATGRGYTDVVKVLVQYGADLSLKNSHWDTPVNVANPNANEMSQLLRGICRGSPTATSMSQSFASEKSSSPVHNLSYMTRYSPPLTSIKPNLSSSHEDVRNALSNKIHRKLSRDSMTPSSPVSGRDSPNFKKRVKTTKVVKVTVGDENLPLGQLIPLSEGNKIPVITKSGVSNMQVDEPILSNDSGIGSWRVESDPGLSTGGNPITIVRKTVKHERTALPEQMEVGGSSMSQNAGSSVNVAPAATDENSMGFTIQQHGYQTVSDGVNVRVEKVPPINIEDTYQNMDIDYSPKKNENVGPANITIVQRGNVKSVAGTTMRTLGQPIMRTIDGSNYTFDHMYGTPVASSQPNSAGKEKSRITKEDAPVAPTISNSGFDVTAVPVYRKAMQNGQQMSKSKEREKIFPVASPLTRVTLSGTKRQSSHDSDEEFKLVIVEKGDRTRPLKKTVSLSCPSSPSLNMRSAVDQNRSSPLPNRVLET